MRSPLRIAEKWLIPTEARLGWERTRLDKAYAKSIAEARKTKDKEKVESLERDHRFEIDLHDEEEDEYITRKLLSRPPGIGFFQPCNQLNRRPNRRLLDNFPVPKEYDYWTMVLAVD